MLSSLERERSSLPAPTRDLVDHVLARRHELFERILRLLPDTVEAQKTRCHGDFHLGQVIVVQNDFFIIDFEGEPARSLSERRLKRSALNDVAGMLRSFHYAANHAIMAKHVRPEDLVYLEKWAEFWQMWVGATYLKEYLKIAGPGQFLPREDEELEVLLAALVLQKAVYEVGYELNNRPAWVKLPLRGILQILGTPAPVG